MFQYPARNGELTVLSYATVVLRSRMTNRRANRQRPSEARCVAWISILDYSFVSLETIDSWREMTVTSLNTLINTFILARAERFLCVTFSLLSQIWCMCFKQEYKCKVKLVNLYKPIVKDNIIYVMADKETIVLLKAFRRQPCSTFPR